MISESPSKTTSCSPSSMEKEIAFLQARASTSSTVDGRVMRSDRAAITIPSESLITTPMHPMPVSWKSLHHYWLCTELVGEVTGVLGGPPFFAAMGCLGWLEFMEAFNGISIDLPQRHRGCSHSLCIPIMPDTPSNVCKYLCQMWWFLC